MAIPGAPAPECAESRSTCHSGRACARMCGFAFDLRFWTCLHQNARVRASSAIECAESRCICASRRACAREWSRAPFALLDDTERGNALRTTTWASCAAHSKKLRNLVLLAIPGAPSPKTRKRTQNINLGAPAPNIARIRAIAIEARFWAHPRYRARTRAQNAHLSASARSRSRPDSGRICATERGHALKMLI